MDSSFVPLAMFYLVPYLVSVIVPGWRSLWVVAGIWLVAILAVLILRPGGGVFEGIYGPMFLLGAATGVGLRAATLRLKADTHRSGLGIALVFFGAFFVPVLLYFAPLWVDVAPPT